MDKDLRDTIDRASAGDGRAIDQLLEMHLSGLKAFVKKRMGALPKEKLSGSDIVQSVCLEILQHLDRYQYRGSANFKNWLYATALRKISDKQRRFLAARRDVRRERAEPSSPSGTHLSQILVALGTPSRFAQEREQLERAEQAFGKLQEREQRIIMMARVEQRSAGEIAEELKLEPANVRMILSRALARLARFMDEK